MIDPKVTELAKRLEKELADRGKIIEGGWIALKIMSVPKDAPQVQIDEMRNSFFAGAAHLFKSIMSILDPGEEPTDDDMRRFSLINDELDIFISEFELKHELAKVQG